MIVLDNEKEILTEGTSKGNQTKFYKNGYWIKFDNQGCSEGLAEEFVSLFCDCIYDFSHVMYKTNKFLYKDIEYNGCMSYNMYDRIDVEFISLRKLLRQLGVPLNICIREQDIKKNIYNVIEIVGKNIGLDLTNYFRQLLLLDALIINEDRHIMNIGVCSFNGKYMIASCFDNGSSLFCINWIYRKTKTLEENIESAKSVARPFSKFYEKQVQAVLDLGCKPLLIDKGKVEFLTNNYYNNLYSEEMNTRIKAVLVNRLNYYEGKAFIYV